MIISSLPNFFNMTSQVFSKNQLYGINNAVCEKIKVAYSSFAKIKYKFSKGALGRMKIGFLEYSWHAVMGFRGK